MTITAKDCAALDKDSYKVRSLHEKVALNGVLYEVIGYCYNPITGYRGTAYRRIDTHEVAVANRGTEPHGDGKYQDIIVDAGMVLAGINAQMPDARSFLHQVKKYVAEDAADKNQPVPPITLTGHSLGGPIAEILAYENHLLGVTFNGYGAVGMGYHIPRGGNQVINYVRATDVVSAASHHFGSVVVLATQDDIERLRAAGYTDTATSLDLRSPFAAMSFSAHSIDNFAPDNPDPVPSDLAPENIARAEAHHHAINLYREDVQALRSSTLSLPWELEQKQRTAMNIASFAAAATLHGDFHEAGQFANLAVQRASANARHVWDAASHTALLTHHAIDQAEKWAVDEIKTGTLHIYDELDRIGTSLGKEAIEHAPDATLDAALDLTHDDTGQRTLSAHKATHDALIVEESISLSARLDRMIAAADAGDWKSFDHDTAALADMPPGRQLLAHAREMVNLEDRLVAQHHAEMQKVQQDLQQAMQPQHVMSHARSR